MANAKHTGRKIALGALLAGAVGYVSGILTAPKSGEETRRDIAGKAGDVKEETIEQLKSLQIELDELTDAAKSKSLSLRASGRKEFNQALVRAKDAKNKTGTLLKSVRAGEAEDEQLNKAIKQAKSAAKNLAKFYKS